MNKVINVPMQDIYKNFSISKSTISMVLSGRGDEKCVSKETQEKILKFAKENNNKAKQLARGLGHGKRDMIGVVIANISDNFYARTAWRIERNAEKFKCHVVFRSTGKSQERENKLIPSMPDREADGLIIASSQKNEVNIKKLKRSNFWFVLVDKLCPEIDTNHVRVDNKGSISLAVEQLIKQGRKRIGFIAIKPGIEAIDERLFGFKQTMEKHGFQVEEGFIEEFDYENVEIDICNVIDELVQFLRNIDGLVFATHYLAAAGLMELKKLDIVIPNDVAIVSFGQKSTFDLIEPSITSVVSPSDEIGDKAVDILLRNTMEEAHEYGNMNLVVRK